MFKLIGYELKKLLSGKMLLLSFTLLVVLNCIIAGSGISSEQIKSEKNLSEFVGIYKNNPEALDSYIAEYRRLFKQASVSGGEKPQSIYSDSDASLFLNFDKIKSLNSEYRAFLGNMKTETSAKLLEYRYYGYTEGSFEVTYQTKTLEAYERLSSLELPFENVIGWDVFFGYNGYCALLLIALTVCGIMLVSPEKNLGMLIVLRTAKKGRTETFLAKAAAGFTVSVILCLLFTVSTLVTLYFRTGLSDPFIPIQTVSNMSSSPFIITVVDGVLISLGTRILISFAFVSVTMLFACLFNNLIMAFAFPLGFIAVNYGIAVHSFPNSYSLLNHINLFRCIGGTAGFDVLSGVKLFGNYADGRVTVAIIYTGVLIIALCLGCLSFSIGNYNNRKAVFPTVKLPAIKLPGFPTCAKTDKKTDKQAYHTLFHYELKKLLSPAAVIVIIFFAVFSVYLSIDSFNLKQSYADNLCIEYNEKYKGEWTPAKQAEIEGEFNELNRVISQKAVMDERYEAGEITVAEYSVYQGEYYTALTSQTALSDFYNHSLYLKEQSENGKDVGFFNSNGFETLLETDFSFVLCAALILIFSDVYASEHRSGFIWIQKTSKRGRTPVVFAKLGSTVLLAFILCLFAEALQFACAGIFLGLDGGELDASSIEALELSVGTVFSYFMFSAVKNIVLGVLLALVCTGVSYLCKKLIPALCIMGVAVYLPSIISYFGVTAFDKISFISFFAR